MAKENSNAPRYEAGRCNSVLIQNGMVTEKKGNIVKLMSAEIKAM